MTSQQPEQTAWTPPVQFFQVCVSDDPSATAQTLQIHGPWNEASKLSAQPASGPTTYTLIAHGGPVHSLSDSFDHGLDLDDAIQEWERNTQDLLGMWHKDRGRKVLVDQSVLQNANHPKRVVLANKLGVDTQALAQALASIDSTPFAPPPTSAHLLAGALVEADESLRKTAVEMQSATLGGDVTPLDSRQFAARLNAQIHALSSEIKWLREALSIEIEKSAKSETELTRRQTQNRALSEKLADFEALRVRNDALLSQTESATETHQNRMAILITQSLSDMKRIRNLEADQKRNLGFKRSVLALPKWVFRALTGRRA